MPLDAYRVDESLFHAEHVLVEACMRGSGFDYRRPPIDIAARSESLSIGGRNLFNVVVAAKWGYSGAPDPNGEIIRAAEAAATAWTPEEDAQYLTCLDGAREEFPPSGMRINNALSGFGLSAWTGAVMEPKVVAAAERWVGCVRSLGFTDLPSSPYSEDGGMPTESMADAYGEIADGRMNEQTPEQEAEEIRLATFDAECRESSGYAQALYDAEWDRQMTVVEENEDALATLLEEKTAFEKQAREILDGAGVG
ncbi:hypothetical protein NSA53_12965 [Cellulosimicrobium cellulans]|nr:hypothetical protein [Cellulosimicrobium cellulans]